jgi:acetyl esterase/lipase
MGAIGHHTMTRRLAKPIRIAIISCCCMGLIAASVDSAMAQIKVPDKKGPPPQKLPEGVKAERDLEYGPHGERNKLDLFVPKGDGPFPLIIWVHGGGWAGGSKNGNAPALRLLERGFAVAAINYRLSSQAIFPAQINDCKAAVRFLRANAKKFNLDPDHFGAWGSSAGGHLVALLGTSGDVKDLEGDGLNKDVSSRVQAVCDWFGPTDFTRMNEQATVKGPIDHDSANSPESKLIGGAIQDNKDKARKANPLEYIGKQCPPFLILHGDRDNLVPVKQSEILNDALKKAGVESTLIVVAGGGHGQGIGAPEHFQKIEEFFTKHLKLAK